MSVIRITLSEDFDKRYKEYRKKFNDDKMPEPFLIDRLASERERFPLINNKLDYENEVKKWSPLKIVVDAIYKELSPFEKRSQTVKVDLSKLALAENVASSVLMMLVYERVCHWEISTSAVVISTLSIQKYISGNGIVVPDYEKFQQLRKEVHDFYNFLENTRKQKFPEKLPTVLDLTGNFKPTVEGQLAAFKMASGETLKEGELTQRFLVKVDEKFVGKKTEYTPNDLPVIDYNQVTGIGYVGEKKFKLKDGQPEYRVFGQLYARIGKRGKLERHDVLIAGGFYQDHEEPDPLRKTSETAFINDIAKSLRDKTGLDIEQLVNNGGNLTLVATKSPKSTPK